MNPALPYDTQPMFMIRMGPNRLWQISVPDGRDFVLLAEFDTAAQAQAAQVPALWAVRQPDMIFAAAGRV